jgi:hypothetical protein
VIDAAFIDKKLKAFFIIFSLAFSRVSGHGEKKEIFRYIGSHGKTNYKVCKGMH